jgi:ParB-like chromosome segregation protein Spo0J
VTDIAPAAPEEVADINETDGAGEALREGATTEIEPNPIPAEGDDPATANTPPPAQKPDPAVADATVKRGRGRPPSTKPKDAAPTPPAPPAEAAEPAAEYFPAFPIDGITIGERHRKDMGDVQEFADSIQELGLLQPIGITPSCELVYGCRRIEAFKLLGRTHISARVIKIDNIAKGEHAENEIRKEFTVSERVAILEALARKPVGHPSDNRQDLVDKDEAAKLAGFSNRETARQATAVVREGVPELVEAVDRGAVSIDAAAAIVKQPPEEQKRIVALPAPERKAEVRQFRKPTPLIKPVKLPTTDLGPLIKPPESAITTFPAPKVRPPASTITTFSVPKIENPLVSKDDDDGAASVRVSLTNAKQAAVTLYHRMHGDVFRQFVDQCIKLRDGDEPPPAEMLN